MEKINLHSRQKKILSILNSKHGIATGKEISAKIGVSERTVRSDISNINDCLKAYDIQILSIHGKGYTLSMKNRSVYLKLFSEKENYVTKEDRLRTLILKLLRENDWCDIGDLEDKMFVSHTTLEKDIKGIKKMISQQQPFLKVERKGNMIRLEDDEQKKRNLFTRFYVENWDYDSEEGIVLEYEEIGKETLSQIHHTLQQKIIEYRVYLDDYAFIYLTLAIYVSFFRIQAGHAINLPKDLAQNRKIKVDKIIRMVVDELNQTWQLEISEDEYVYLSKIKEQLVLLSERTYSKNYVLSTTDVVCHHIVDDVINELLEEYGIDFTTDNKLFVDLTRHVQALKNGIVPTSSQNHVIADELRRKYPFMSNIAYVLKNKLSEKCDMALGKEEDDYLLPFLILAEESLYRKRRHKGIPTAVISHYNESMSHYLMEMLKSCYGDVLELHGPYSIHAKKLIDQKRTMLVLTTTKMKKIDEEFKAPVLTVSPLIGKEDKKCIDLFLANMKSCYLYAFPKLPTEQYFPEQLCYTMDNKNNLQAALSEMQQKMENYMGTDELPKLNLEQSYYCLLENGFFFCYQVCPKVAHATASLVELNKEISYKYVRNIKSVMYMILPPTDKNLLGWIYDTAIYLSQHPNAIKKI